MTRRRPRVSLRFSIRTAVAAMFLFAVGFAVITAKGRRQLKVIRWVEANGGWYEFDWQRQNDGQFTDATCPSKPAWLNWAGDEHFQSLTAIHLVGTEAKDLSQLSDIKTLKTLSLGKRTVDLRPLSELSQLETLGMCSAGVRDLAPLAKLTQLQTLDLSSTEVRDLTVLRNLTQLSWLNLSNAPVTEDSVTQLRRAIPKCWILSSHGVGSLQEIERQRKLRSTPVPEL